MSYKTPQTLKNLARSYNQGGLEQVEEQEDFELYDPESDWDDDDFDPYDFDSEGIQWTLQHNRDIYIKEQITKEQTLKSAQYKTALSQSKLIERERHAQENSAFDILNEFLPPEMVEPIFDFMGQIPLSESISWKSKHREGQIKANIDAANRTNKRIERLESQLVY